MPFQARSVILQEIGTELQAGVLAYVTGDRENLETEVPGASRPATACSTPTCTSVSQQVVQHATCPAVVVNQPATVS